MSSTEASRTRLAVVLSHPIQYFSPWFAQMAAAAPVDLRVFYLWDFGVTAKNDPQFGCDIKWDIPLLDGYGYEFVPNRSVDAGTHHVRGLDNPDLPRRIAAWAPDAILFFGYSWWSHMRAIYSNRLHNIPKLLRGDSHELGRAEGPRGFLGRNLRRIVFRMFDGFLAVGKANAAYYQGAGVSGARIHFAPHAVDNDRFRRTSRNSAEAAEWRSSVNIPSGSPVVLFSGKFDGVKRPLDLLSAFTSVVEGHANVQYQSPRLLFVGDGALGDSIRTAAGDRLGRDVFVVPFQNQRAMPAVYANADLLVLPSQSETWGLAVNEAMNLSVPAIVSSHVGCGPDLIVEGKTGWTYPAGDVGALAATLRDALGDPDRLAEMGRAAKAQVAGYSYEAATAGLLEALDAILGDQRGQ